MNFEECKNSVNNNMVDQFDSKYQLFVVNDYKAAQKSSFSIKEDLTL